MTTKERPPCDCPKQPCGCFAAGREKAFFEFISKLNNPRHPEGCVCEICGTSRAWAKARAAGRAATRTG